VRAAALTSFDVSILVPGLAVEWDTLETKSLGGSESAGLYMARALSIEGARVTVFCNSAATWVDGKGVRYVPAREWAAVAKAMPHDVCIVQRAMEAFGQRTNARLNLLWCHDLALGRQERALRGLLWNVDGIIVVSKYMAEQYKEVYGISEEALLVSRNGVDVSLVQALRSEGIRRDRNKLMFCARPERGLDVLLEHVMPKLLAAEKDLKLYVAGYDNQVPDWQDFYARCKASAARLGDRVVHLGCLSKPELYRHYLSARAYVYPTPSAVLPGFREVSCISAMECQAAGLPIVTTALGALPETIAAGAGALVQGDPSSETDLPRYVDQFADAVLQLVRDDGAWSAACESAQARGEQLEWSAVARTWLAEFERMIRERNDSSERLARHFWRASDAVAEEQIGRFEEPKNRVEGEAQAPALDDETLPLLESWLRTRATEIASVLDYGCAGGACAGALAKRFHPLRVLCIEDFDRCPIEAAPFDCALVRDVLQRVPEPWALLERVEGLVRQGGTVYVAVPYGPPEMHATDRRRPRKWQLDVHDLRDMIGGKPDLSIEPVYVGDDSITDEPRGWWVVTYRCDHKPVPRIDLARHLWLQRPRQTVSAAIIAGPASEETLHWTLRSIENVVDEVVLADCGMNEEARRIARQYDVKLVVGVDPLKHGFDVARNLALDACTSDWCLWIDTDERLVGGRELQKYLRENVYHAYALRQHNFTCDAPMSPDLPCRLFRRRPHLGRVARFLGAIHEHPELALNEGAGPMIGLNDVHIAHVGYLGEDTRRSRFARNSPLLKLDQARYPDRLLQKYFLMRENAHLVRYALGANGGRVDAEIRARCRETVELYRKCFLGAKVVLRRDALEYYSEALTVLGEGFEAAFQIEADKAEARPNGVRRYRFATTEDFQAELARTATEKASRFDSKWW
jgi:glycosyltransferase involved in cell wall biosynthesis